jgi:hypothetical protein
MANVDVVAVCDNHPERLQDWEYRFVPHVDFRH